MIGKASACSEACSSYSSWFSTPFSYPRFMTSMPSALYPRGHWFRFPLRSGTFAFLVIFIVNTKYLLSLAVHDESHTVTTALKFYVPDALPSAPKRLKYR